MKIEIIKVSNGLGDTTYRAVELDKFGKRSGTIGMAHTLEGAETLAYNYKLRSEIKEETLKVYEI